MISGSNRQSWVFRVKLGDLPASGNITNYTSSPSGQITSVTYSNTASVARVQINHQDPGWDYRVFVTMYSDTINTNDNDGGSHNFWSHSPNRTSTFVLFEYAAEGNTQNIGYNVMLQQI